jgi:hypothetical protein
MDLEPEFRRLAAAILWQAVRDLDLAKHRQEAALFLVSDGARDLAQEIGIRLRPSKLAYRKFGTLKRGRVRKVVQR